MPKMRRKADLPTKTCSTCGRPFTWRKKWAAVWNEVLYCSDRCRNNHKIDDGRTGRRDAGLPV